jgi:quinol-cytochrome oxidoreductase complex cytochrome b subunit
MQSQIRFTLVIAAALYMGWGLALLLAPEMSHSLVSKGPYDPVTTAMFGAAMVGMMIMFVIAAYDPEREIVRAAAAGLAVVGFTAAYLIFIAKVMPLRPITVISLLVDLGACAVLFLTEARLDLRQQTKGRRPTAVGRRRHA